MVIKLYWALERYPLYKNLYSALYSRTERGGRRGIKWSSVGLAQGDIDPLLAQQ